MRVLMVGPHKDKVNGGMSTVIRDYTESKYLSNFEIFNIHTVIPGSILKKVTYGIISMFVMIYNLALKNIDIVHIHTASGKSFFRKSIFIKISKLFNKYTILHIHGGGFEDFYTKESSIKKQKKITKTLDMCNKVVVLSEGWKHKIGRMTTTEIEIVCNSVDENNINEYNHNSKEIIFVGRLEKEKGIYDLIQAANDIIKIDSTIVFKICGDGEINEVKELVSKYNLEKSIKFLGWLSKQELEKQLKQSMVLVLPSYKEAMPMAILEAMSYGLPIISTSVGSIPEFIKEGKNGFLFSPGDIGELVELIKKIITDKELRDIFSNNNLKDVKEKYNNKINHNRIRQIYLSATAEESVL